MKRNWMVHILRIMDSKRSLIYILAFLILATNSFAQEAKQLEIEEAERQHRTWQMRVDNLTTEIFTDSSALSGEEQSFYLALLAKIWWKQNENEARGHLKTASQRLLLSLKFDDQTDIGTKLRHFQKALETISALDEKLGQDLIGRLREALESASDKKKNEDLPMADLFVSVARQVTTSNPKMAQAYGRQSLGYGFAMYLPTLINEVNLKDAALAELLARQAVIAAKISYTSSSSLFLFNLNRNMVELNKGPAFSDALHRFMLEAFAERLANAVAIEQERRNRCGIAFYAPAVLTRVDEYLPALSITFRQNLQTCISYTSNTTQEMTKAASADEPKTVDDMLRVARDTKDVGLKVAYYRKAFGKLEHDKEFEEMVSTLDGLDGDDFKKLSPIGWDRWRISAGYGGALAAFEVEDLPATYRFIDKSPGRLRPYVRSQLVAKSSVVKNKGFYLENLDKMQKELSSLEIPSEDAARLYRELTNHYLKARPTDAEVVFRNAVKYINKTDAENPDFLVEKDWAPMQHYVALTSELLEIDEISITASLNNLSSRRSRARLKLGLLESSLKKYAEAKKHLEELRKSKKLPDSRKEIPKKL